MTTGIYKSSMSLLLEWIGPTLGLGLVAFATALAICAGVVSRRTPRLRSASQRHPGGWLLIAAVAVMLLGSLLVLKSSPFNAYSFDQRLWAVNRFAGYCGRGQMAGDLLRFHLRPGMPRAAVVRLLGPPDLKDRTEGGEEVYRYDLGACSGFQVDTDYLDVVFDGAARVVKAYCWQS
jgi:hypothetical protein